ncbi:MULTISPECIES: DUF4037 domain-containing protein [Kitasatospora]|uniref:DUF4037 domain-containing protein n=1 Tax=Kitasatospora setae (strain ATCC 33774 / DSM 43861 / JCM 3304 / KCC A-0304 / NBRC 14216 / KM-6054) TaxID=452652 RepID=E4N384_KITSK|nr:MULTISPECIES: DUF4037 domain-containing protein [Kitasatospora]BAJ32618.1 hypothetical protein KSE_68600 [Kitasatospora setae KM-6054]
MTATDPPDPPVPLDPPFVPGLDLARALYEEAVRPILARAHPGLRHAAARIGPGSEVLGFDTARSTDHDWGPRLQLFLDPADARRHGPAIRELLAERLPGRIRGWSTHYRRSGDPHDPVSHLEPAPAGLVDHRVTVHDLPTWLAGHLGPPAAAWAATDPGPTDWLALPQQRLAEFTAGAVFHDGPGILTAARARLRWYPDQVWRHLLACQWQRIAQEEAFVGRCAEAGDDLGAALTTARLVRDLIRLTFLMSRRYAPYGKWLGTAFDRLDAAPALAPHLRAALAAADPAARERHLCDAYRAAARAHNALGLTAPLDPARRRYHGRPYLVLHADRFARALQQTVTAPELRDRPLTGAVDQWADGTDLLAHPEAVRAAVDAIG